VKETIDMTQKTIVITGASDGIGAAAARRLHESGDKIVVIGRSEAKTTAVAAELGADYFVADFADLAQVRALADKIRSEYPRIDVLVNNAGLMAKRGEVTPDGFGTTYQVNYLAPFLLTTTLLDLLIESKAAIVNTTSSSHRLVRVSCAADLDKANDRRPSIAYAFSKLAVVLFTKELHRRHHGAGLCTATVHPGYVASNFGHASGSKFLKFMEVYSPVERFTATSEEGAEQLIWLASSKAGVDWKPGEYYSRKKVAKPHRSANDARLAGELWERTLAKVSG
jgi:NAD(P)-dependent dehydrogenase (short-subunit alcohol dehydrogenase family)